MASNYSEKLATQFKELVGKGASMEELEAFAVKAAKYSFLKGMKYAQSYKDGETTKGK